MTARARGISWEVLAHDIRKVISGTRIPGPHA